MKRNNSKPQAEFNFENLSFEDLEYYGLLQARVNGASASGDEDALAEAFQERREFLARVTVDIPREWLMSSTPETVDWSDPASFSYIRGTKFLPFLQALNDAMEVESKK